MMPKSSPVFLVVMSMTLFTAVANAATLTGNTESSLSHSLAVGGCGGPICADEFFDVAAGSSPSLRIDPEGSEQIGDEALVCATWQGSVQTEITGSATAAAASGGGSITTNPIPAGASTGDAFVVIRRSGSSDASVNLASVASIAPPGDTESLEQAVTLQTQVGDELGFGISIALAASTEGFGDSSASASARSGISVELGPCEDDSGGPPPGPPAPVPTLSEWSLIVLVMLLAAIGYRRVRKQQG
jgi:hypothetical protein